MITLFEMYEGRTYVYYYPLRNDWMDKHIEVLTELKKYKIEYDFYEVGEWVNKIKAHGITGMERSNFNLGHLTHDALSLLITNNIKPLYEKLPYYSYILIVTNMKKYPKCYMWGNEMNLWLPDKDEKKNRNAKFFKIKSSELPETMDKISEEEVLKNMKIWNRKYEKQFKIIIRDRDANKFGI